MIHNTQYTIHNTSFHRIIFHLLVALIPTQLGFHFWPEWALVLGRRIDYLSPTLYFTDALIALMLGSWMWECRKSILYAVSRILYIKNVGYTIHNTKYTIQNLAYTTLGAYIAINIYLSISPPAAIYAWIKIIEFGLLGLYIVKTKPSLFIIHNSLFIAVLYSSALAIAQFILQHSVGGIFWFLGERTFSASTPGIAQYSLCLPYLFSGCQLLLRPYATFSHPNVLGGFLAAVLPLLIFNLQFPIFKKTKKFSIGMFVTILLGIVALVLSFSRSAWMVGGMGILYSVLRIVYKEKTRDALYAIHYTQCAILFIASLIFMGIYVYFFPSTGDESVVVRQQLNVAAFHIWKSAPLFGVGAGNFLIALPHYLPAKLIYFLQPVHNIYLLVLSEVGVVGVSIIIFVLCILYRVLSIKKYTIHNTLYATPMFSLLLLGLIDHHPLTLQQGRLLLTLVLSISYSVFCIEKK